MALQFEFFFLQLLEINDMKKIVFVRNTTRKLYNPKNIIRFFFSRRQFTVVKRHLKKNNF